MHAARVGVRGDNGATCQGKGLKAGTFPHVRDIDDHAPLIEPPDHLAAEVAQPGICVFQAAIANEVAGVVGELEDTDPQCVIGIDEIHILFDGVATLEVQSHR
jgi:hypothetical protein